MIHPSDGRTDGQRGGWAIAYTRYSIYAVARKKPNTNSNCAVDQELKKTKMSAINDAIPNMTVT